MWGTLARQLFGFLAKNWAGLGVGYAVSDIANDLKPKPEPVVKMGVKLPPEEKPTQSWFVRKMQEIFGFEFPKWGYGIIAVVILYYLSGIIENFSRKK